METHKTKEYNIFQKLECNRDLHEGNFKKILKSIQESNLLESNPITVDKNMYVIDGQHRLEVAKRLNLPIWYQVRKDVNLKDIILLNNNGKGWSISDYLNHYSKIGGYPDYEALKSFSDTHNIDVNITLHILSSERNTGFYKDFKEGKYKFPEQETFLKAVQNKKLIDETIEFIKKKTSGNKIYLERVTFYSALTSFFSKENFSYDIFFKKLQYKLDLMRACSKREEYLKIFQDIYNWKNHSPLEK